MRACSSIGGTGMVSFARLSPERRLTFARATNLFFSAFKRSVWKLSDGVGKVFLLRPMRGCVEWVSGNGFDGGVVVLTTEQASALLQAQGFALIDEHSMRQWLGDAFGEAQAQARFQASWDRLPPDLYLKDGGHYRFRRHASAIVGAQGQGGIERVAHRPHWQPTTYNALHGGIRRWFEPIEAEAWDHALMQGLLLRLGALFARAATPPVPRWFVEVHPFRIDARFEVGKPTPEGAHRDGVDFVAVVLIGRVGVEGGETTVRSTDGEVLARCTLTQPWSALLMDDRRVIHETTPIRALAPVAHRDTLVLTYRVGGFMQPDEPPEAAGA